MANIKDKLGGKTKRLVGEVVGDQKLHDEGKAQKQRGREEEQQRRQNTRRQIKPLGKLDQLT
jgi:uncharacterized protein YjbJ (UPF0337 family)